MNNAILIQPATGMQMLFMGVTEKLHKVYCERWNIDYRVVRGEKPPHKACLLLEAFDEGYEFVFVLDADTMIVRDGIDMRSACEAGKIGCTWHTMPSQSEDCYDHWNIGALYVRRGGSLDLAFNMWGGMHTLHDWGEQHTFNNLNMPVHRLDHRWNSMPFGAMRDPDPIVMAWHGFRSTEERAIAMRREYDRRFGEPIDWTGQHVDLFLSAQGIGDACCALYAACGAADVTGDVTLHTQHVGFAARVQHPGLTIVADDKTNALQRGWFDVSFGYQDQLVTGQNRKEWYCENLRMASGLEVKPTAPKFVNNKVFYPRRNDKYVVFAPFSCFSERHWIDRHWRRLFDLIQESGRSVAIIDVPDGRDRVKACFGNCESKTCSVHYGENAEFVTDLLLGAECVVTLDSGMAHVGGLLGVPTVAIMAQLEPSMIFSHTKVIGATPQTDCTFCRWQPSRGYRAACQAGCSAIATVSPEQVMNAIGTATAG